MFNRLILITQLHRSGGTLFSQLLDGHASVQAHPHELFIGKPEKWDWPELGASLSSPEAVFEALQEEKIAAIGAAGSFIKPGSNKAAKDQAVPFGYSIDQHRGLFCDSFRHAPVASQRLAIQLYLDTFFLAWPEYRTSGREQFTSCFLPHILMHEQSMARLYRDFPDIVIVNLLRRPDTWLASLVNHVGLDLQDTEKVGAHLERWRLSIKKILAIHDNPCVQAFATAYEALVTNPREEMQRFCTLLGVSFEPILLLPTVGGYPVLPNSSYRRESSGINTDSLELRTPLPGPVATLVGERYQPVYVKARKKLGITVPHA
jgi:hypothetical protein